MKCEKKKSKKTDALFRILSDVVLPSFSEYHNFPRIFSKSEKIKKKI